MSDVPFRRHIRRAIKIAGSGRRLALASNISQQEVSRLNTTALQIAPEIAIAIEVGTGGVVARGDLRPDLWPRVAIKQVA